jgi:hypothetical protein
MPLGSVAWRLEAAANNEGTLNYKISWARTLLEVNFIPISKALFKALVKSPRSSQPDTSQYRRRLLLIF